MCQAEKVEGFFNSATHHIWRKAKGFHAVGEFVLDNIGDETTHRILRNDSDNISKFARWMSAGISSGHCDSSTEGATGEMWDKTINALE